MADNMFGLALLSMLASAFAVAAPAFVAKPCDARLPAARVTCGTVTVPENPAAPQGRTIALNVVIVKAARPAAGAIPMFHLEGGPGVPATPAAMFYVGPGALYAESRDVVLIDQRGTGGSAALQCPDARPHEVWDEEYDP